MISMIFQRGLWKYDRSQVGLIYPVFIRPLFVLELPYRDNQPKISCIPPGKYVCYRDVCSKNKLWSEAFYIKENFPERDRIICGHIGNDYDDTEGCILFGLFHDEPNHISHSTDAIYKWRDAMKPYNEFELEIVE